MQPLAYAAIFAGAILLVAGVSASSITSVARGAPDHAMALAGARGAPPSGAAGVSGGVAAGGSRLLGAATSQLGVPYKWGGELARVEFDCSGLVQWAAAQAGVKLPRTAAEQFKATRRITADEAGPGDLVFFSNGSEVSHVGIVVRHGVMIDAPHTGARVRYENFTQALGAAWGSDHVIGFGRP